MAFTTSPARTTTGALTLSGLVEEAARAHPSAMSLLAPARTPLTYDGLLRQLKSVGEQLAAFGLSPSSRLASVLPNGPEAATFAIGAGAYLGCAPLNPRYRKKELEFYLHDLGAAAVVVPSEGSPEAEAAATELGIGVLRVDVRPGAPAGEFRLAGLPTNAPLHPQPAPENNVALLLHTSGTTSRPKLVPLTQKNLCTSAMNISHHLQLTTQDRCLNIMPLFHIHGLVGALLAAIASGGSVICTDGVYGSVFFEWMREFQPTWYSAVPTMHQGIVALAAKETPVIPNSLRFVRSSSAALPPSVLEQLESVFGVPVVEGYGMTEASHQMTCNPLPPAVRKPGSVGIPGVTEIAILGPGGKMLGPDEAGEVIVRGEAVTSGYANNEAANREAFDDGWLRTGDLGSIDRDGYLFLLGRIKEQINRGGEKISPREIDEVLLRHPAVAQAVAFAVPHKQLGEEIAAVVVAKPGSSIDAQQLRSFAVRELATFKVPRIFHIVDEIPKGATGKVQRIGLAKALGIGELDDAARALEHVAPRNETEERIAAIWRDLFRAAEIGVKDRFSALGGDSLLAVQMLATVREKLGCDSEFPAFLDEQTIESVAREVTLRRRPFEQLRSGGARAPLYCLPGHDDVLLGLKHLATALEPGRPVYAGGYKDHVRGGVHSVEALGTRFAEELSRIGSGHTHVLVGACFGGFVLLEAARHVRERGSTPVLVLIDAVHPQWRSSASPAEYGGALLRQMSIKTPYHLRTLARLGPAGGAAYLIDRSTDFAKFHGENRRARAADAPAHDSAAIVLRKSALEYNPRPWDGPVLLIQSRGRRLDARRMGWSRVLTGEVEQVDLPFHPNGSLCEALAGQTAAAIDRYLARFDPA